PLPADGAPLDVLVIPPSPFGPGAITRCRAVGVLNMPDEAGQDAKLLAVPHSNLPTIYDDIKDIGDVPELLIKQIEHFFENYKDLEKGKWVKVDKWEGRDAAIQAIEKAVAAVQGN